MATQTRLEGAALTVNPIRQQVLASHIQTVASRYRGDLSKVYQTAADRWRHPYWDWAAYTKLPDVLVQPNVTINSPDGAVTVDNPLVTYKFQSFPLNQTLFPPDCDEDLDTYPQTLRCLDRATNTSQPDVADDNLYYIDLGAQVVGPIPSLSYKGADS